MLFTEFQFLLFFAVVWVVHWNLTANTGRKLLLLAASYLFYGAWDYRFLGLIILSSAWDFFLARRIGVADSDRARRSWLIASLVSNLGLLFLFKYFNFFAQSLTDLFALFGMGVSRTTLEIVLPVGISFYTFQTLSYTIDVYKKKIEPLNDFLDLALYVAFFPQLVAGPIVRAVAFLPQLRTPRRLEDVAIKTCLVLFWIGFVKKACISDNLAPLVDAVFAAPAEFSASAIVLGALFYAIQIYCDFSGYSDMAVASAGLLGYTLPVNFNHPYWARNPTDFWRRWHISLSTWLRDYLYIPLGGGHQGGWPRNRNLMVTMLLGGLWHGASWTFVAWGFMHGLALVIHKIWQERVSRFATWLVIPAPLAILMTFYWVTLAWIFFRATSLSSALDITRAFMLWQASGIRELDVHGPTVLLVLLLMHGVATRFVGRMAWDRVSNGLFALGLGIMAAIAVGFVPTGYHPFIYFQF
ncbi:MAG: MBOAT family protein [Magnetococcales bacterium]|nr:MBOAT family protein [Magnetococcales bacterium]